MINYANLKTSRRLQRVYQLLLDHKQHTTRNIQRHASVCAVNFAVDELRENGKEISCVRKGMYWRYRMIGE